MNYDCDNRAVEVRKRKAIVMKKLKEASKQTKGKKKK